MGDIGLQNAVIRVAMSVERIEKHLAKPDNTVEVNASLAGNTAGFADSLEEIMSSEDHTLGKFAAIRKLIERARSMQQNYSEEMEKALAKEENNGLEK